MGNDLCQHKHLYNVMQQTEIQQNFKENQKNLLHSKQSISKPNSNSSSLKQLTKFTYDGQMKNKKFDGFGKLYQNGQLIYQGQFKNGYFQGWGFTKQYTGQFRQGMYDGYVIYKQYLNQKNNIVTLYYEGYFFDGLYNGMGILIKGANIPLQKLQKIQDGQGIKDYLLLSIQNGNTISNKYGAKQIYIGQLAHGLKNGNGRLFKDNQQYSGQFSGGKYHGHGTVIDPNQQIKKMEKVNKKCKFC